MKQNLERFWISQAGILIRKNKCLILEDANKPGFWDIPGGRINKGELGETAFKREIKEEIGIDNFVVDKIVDYDIWYIPKGNPVCAIAVLIKNEKDEIILSIMEHHSNLLPWQRLSKELNLKLRFIPITKNYALDYNEAEKLITKKTALVSICHISNVLGTINDIEKIIRLAKKNNALTIIDAAQSISHIKIDVKSLDCDFLVFSGHKMLGPTGTGVLYGKEHLLNEMSPFLLGGGIVKDVSTANFVLKDAPEKYEAGTQDYAGAIAFSEAIDYINKLGFENIKEHESELTNYLLKELKYISGIEVYHTNNLNESSGIVSFNIKGIHCHDIASLLNDYNICVRAGHNCAIPLMKSLNIDGCVRVSLVFYNTKEDVDNLISALNKILEFWNIKEENYGK